MELYYHSKLLSLLLAFSAAASVTATITSSLIRCTAAERCEFPAIFNFGDSNSDTGALSAAFRQAPSPNGQTFFRSPAGRFCDGRLIIDFIAESFGLPYISPYLDSVGSNFGHGANFATAGSTIRPPNTTISQSGASPFSLDVQFIQFSDFLSRSQIVRRRGGVFQELLPREVYFSNALYTFDVGQNDLSAGFKFNMTTDQIKAYIPDVIDQFSNVVRDVYGLGGRSFWIHNTGPLGCLPYMLDRVPIITAQHDKFGCASPLNEVAQYFNKGLKAAVAQLRKDLPLAAITYVDVYSLKYALITQAKKFGFEKQLVACCGHGGKYNFDNGKRCGSKMSVKGKEILIAKSCKNPSIRVNWDGIHFTEAANKWVFHHLVNNFSLSDPPIPLNLACHR